MPRIGISSFMAEQKMDGHLHKELAEAKINQVHNPRGISQQPRGYVFETI